MDIHQLNEEEMRTDYRNGDYSKLEEQMKMAEVENMLWVAISEERKQGGYLTLQGIARVIKKLPKEEVGYIVEELKNN